MNNEEIVYKIIKKAQKNGWYKDTEFKVIYYDGSIGSSIFLHATFDDDGHIEKWQRDLETLIYQPYFARAFWGKEHWLYGWNKKDSTDVMHWGWFPPKTKFSSINDHAELVTGKEAWQYHLQQMVLEEDPIKYLEKFL